VAALLTGSCRLGKRAVSQVFADLFGLSISPAAVCDLQRKTAAALQPIAAEALTYTRGRPANVDETSWTEAAKPAWVWVAVTELVVAFLIRRGRDRSAFDDLVGDSAAVLTTDRYSVYTHLPAARRQVCWAHLARDFQAMIDRANPGTRIGADLLAHAQILFRHWARVRDGTLTRRGFRDQYAGWLRREVRSLLIRGAACGCAKTAGTCREILAVEPALWTFARVGGVEPTNNAAEREIRHAVCWRKTSYGTDSAAGSRFVERILTVIGSCRRQNRNVLRFLVDAVQAARTGGKAPSLRPSVAAAA
jgi:transposase